MVLEVVDVTDTGGVILGAKCCGIGGDLCGRDKGLVGNEFIGADALLENDHEGIQDELMGVLAVQRSGLLLIDTIRFEGGTGDEGECVGCCWCSECAASRCQRGGQCGQVRCAHPEQRKRGEFVLGVGSTREDESGKEGDKGLTIEEVAGRTGDQVGWLDAKASSSGCAWLLGCLAAGLGLARARMPEGRAYRWMVRLSEAAPAPEAARGIGTRAMDDPLSFNASNELLSLTGEETRDEAESRTCSHACTPKPARRIKAPEGSSKSSTHKHDAETPAQQPSDPTFQSDIVKLDGEP